MPIVGQFGSLAGFGVFPGGALESIATVTVGSGGAASIEFTSIPSTYQHLQIRWLARSSRSGSLTDPVAVQFNGDTASNYTYHFLGGNGSAASAGAATGQTQAIVGNASAANASASIFSGGVTDILDYLSTSKNTVIRSLAGFDSNGDGRVQMFSNVWLSTSAVTSIKIVRGDNDFVQYTTAALYGVKAP